MLRGTETTGGAIDSDANVAVRHYAVAAMIDSRTISGMR